MKYTEQLNDPLWHAKRCEVLIAANFVCQKCGATEGTLEVHHPKYIAGRMAWEYEVDELECLCDHCHELQHIPDCCHTPLYCCIYDKDARSKIMIPVSPKFCPTCGKEVKPL